MRPQNQNEAKSRQMHRMPLMNDPQPPELLLRNTALTMFSKHCSRILRLNEQLGGVRYGLLTHSDKYLKQLMRDVRESIEIR
jgi:hypothetical protein